MSERMTEHEAALEAQLIAVVLDELRGDRDQREITLDQLRRPIELIDQILQIELVVDPPSRAA